jgi:hypothetical protein
VYREFSAAFEVGDNFGGGCSLWDHVVDILACKIR